MWVNFARNEVSYKHDENMIKMMLESKHIFFCSCGTPYIIKTTENPLQIKKTINNQQQYSSYCK